jgi:hypothetical protein
MNLKKDDGLKVIVMTIGAQINNVVFLNECEIIR